MNSDRVRKDCFKVGNAHTFKEARDIAKAEESADKQLQLMKTEVNSINILKGYQGQRNQPPIPNTGPGKLVGTVAGVPILESSAQRRMLHVTIVIK